MSDLERPWVERRRSGPPSSCPVCGAATRRIPGTAVITCSAWGVGDFEWHPTPEPPVRVEAERADGDTNPPRTLDPSADKQPYVNSLTMPLPQPRPEGYTCTHVPRCRDRREVGDPEWSATELACGRVEVEGPSDEDFADHPPLHIPGCPAMNYSGGCTCPPIEGSEEPLPLTADEVEQLPDGTPITVIWSGGNGPHDYVIAVSSRGTRSAWNGTDERMRFYNPLRFVGVERFHTRVWLREAPAVAIEGDVVGIDYQTATAARLGGDAGRLAELHAPVYGHPPSCSGCSSARRTRIQYHNPLPVAWPCKTAELALGMMGLTASDIAITKKG